MLRRAVTDMTGASWHCWDPKGYPTMFIHEQDETMCFYISKLHFIHFGLNDLKAKAFFFISHRSSCLNRGNMLCISLPLGNHLKYVRWLESWWDKIMRGWIATEEALHTSMTIACDAWEKGTIDEFFSRSSSKIGCLIVNVLHYIVVRLLQGLLLCATGHCT